MPLSNLYTYNIINESNEDYIEAEISINPNHSIFEGHFPGIPILPGVCQVEMIKRILSEFIGKEFILGSAKNIKFLSMLNPTQTEKITASIKIKKVDAGLNVNAELYDNQTKFLKLSAEYRENCQAI